MAGDRFVMAVVLVLRLVGHVFRALFGHPSADKRRALGYFGKWRVAVWSVEAHAAMRLCVLAQAAEAFEQNELHDEADVLWSFAEEQNRGFGRSTCPRGVPWYQLRDWCLVEARNHDLLPRYMRTMVPPKGGAPFHKPQGERGEVDHPPAWDDNEQQGLPWEE